MHRLLELQGRDSATVIKAAMRACHERRVGNAMLAVLQEHDASARVIQAGMRVSLAMGTVANGFARDEARRQRQEDYVASLVAKHHRAASALQRYLSDLAVKRQVRKQYETAYNPQNSKQKELDHMRLQLFDANKASLTLNSLNHYLLNSSL